MKLREWFRWNKILQPKELFKGLARILVSHLARYHTNLLTACREYFKNSRCDFTVDKLKWAENTKILLYVSTYLYSEVYSTDKYEKEEINFLIKTLKNGDVFIDIGANAGIYTVVASKLVGKDGQVFAFEPSKREYELLLRNIKLNKLINVKPLKIAISNYNGTTNFLVAAGKDTGTNTLASKFYSNQIKLERIEKVPVYKLDDYLEQLHINKITGIKIDIEGHDLFALEGMKKTLQKFKPFLMLEISELNLQNTGHSKKQLFELLKNYSYEIFYYDEKGGLTKNPPLYTFNPKTLYYDIVCFPR